MNWHQLMSLNMRRKVRIHSFVLVNISKKRNRARYQKKMKFAYTLFLVDLPYSINKAIRIHVFYHSWHHHFIIWVIIMLQNISSGVSKNVFWQFKIKVGCIFAVIFLWYIADKKPKKTRLLYWVMAYIHAKWYISESVY